MDAAFEVLDIRCDREHGLGLCLKSRPLQGQPGKPVLELADRNRVFARSLQIDEMGRVWVTMEKPCFTKSKTEWVGRIQPALLNRVHALVRDAVEGPVSTKRFEAPVFEASNQSWRAYWEGTEYPLLEPVYDLRGHTLYRRTRPSALALIRLLNDIDAATWMYPSTTPTRKPVTRTKP
jgi:hypothetical protein